jgi:glycogen(starch) synthase
MTNLNAVTVAEISYEVANKVGGIYTVLASKASNMTSKFKDYWTIGPYYEKKAAIEFEEVDPPYKLKKAFDNIQRRHGIVCRYGRWLVESKPRCILVDPGKLRGKTDKIKKEMWDHYKVDSLHADGWYDEPLPWSKAAGMVVEELMRSGVFKKNTIAHFHEWLSGVGLLYLKTNKSDAKTIFTTHSTVLGRTIAEHGKEDLYELIKKGFSKGQAAPKEKAYDYKCQGKHLLEKATAINSDIFTTVSETAAIECEYVLGRKPDIILPNGLDMENFPFMEDLSDMHILYRNHMRRFVMSYFSPYYEIDAKNSLFFFLSGRFEMHNKGIDVFIDALGKLNKKLKSMNSNKIVVVFIWVPEGTKGRKTDVLENIEIFDQIENIVEKESEEIEDRIMHSIAQGRFPSKTDVFDNEFLDSLKRMELMLKSKRDQLPPITPFNLYRDNSIITMLKRNNLNNKKGDKVKIIYYPTYLSPTDGLLNMSYYNGIIGCHVGIFPSYYESWGYTPLETAALGLQSITTDLSGFGRFIAPHLKNDMSIIVLPRKDVPYDKTVLKLSEIFYQIYKMSKEERGKNKILAKELSMLAGWKNLVKNYIKSYEMAFAKK